MSSALNTTTTTTQFRVNANKEREITPKIPKEGEKTIFCGNYSQRDARTEITPQ